MWACEHFGIKPDMLVTSKSLGAGIPLGAVIVNADMFPDLEPGMHSGIHLADPMAVAAAIANIDMIIKRKSCRAFAVLWRICHTKTKRNRQKISQDNCGRERIGLDDRIEFVSANFRDEAVKDVFHNELLLCAGRREGYLHDAASYSEYS